MGYQEILEMKGLGYLYPNRKGAEKEIKINAPKVPKAVNPRSDKQKVVIAELKKLYPIFLSKKKNCEIKGPECTVKATCIHHTEGRLPSKVLDSTKWVASCEKCNSWVESHHAEAAKKGFKKSKF